MNAVRALLSSAAAPEPPPNLAELRAAVCGPLRANLAASRAVGVALAAIEAVAREASAEGRAELRVTLAPVLTEAMHSRTTTVRAAHLERLVLLVAPPVGGVAAAASRVLMACGCCPGSRSCRY